MSSVIFGGTVSMLTTATPSIGWVVGYDIDGILKQKNQFGVITEVGGGPTSGLATSPSLQTVLLSGNNSGGSSIIMGTSTFIKSFNGGGKLELDYLGSTNSILLSTDNSLLNEHGLILQNGYAAFFANGYQQAIELDNGSGDLSVYNVNEGSVLLGVSSGTGAPYDEIDEIKISYNTTATQSTGDTDKQSVFIGTRNSKISNGVVNTVVIGGQGFTASNSNSVYVPDLYLQNQKGIKSTNSNEVFFLNDSSGYTLLDRNSGNLDSSWLLMASDYQSTYQSYIQIGVNSDPGYGNDSLILISNNKGPSYSYDEYSSINLGKNILRLQSKDVDGAGDELRINMSSIANYITIDGPTASFKGLEYSDDYSLNFATHSLVDKLYVDNQVSTFGAPSLNTVLSVGNSSETYDIIMGTSTVIKTGNTASGGQIDLDFFGGNTVLISTDNGSLGTSYVQLQDSDITLYSTNLYFETTDAEIDVSNNEGLKYSSQQTNLQNRSLVDKEFVDTATASIWTEISVLANDYISGITAGNGLSGGGTSGFVSLDINVGNGLDLVTNTVVLGGTLSIDTDINGLDFYQLNFTSMNRILMTASTYINSRVDGSDVYSQNFLDPNYAHLIYTDLSGVTYSKIYLDYNTLSLISCESGGQNDITIYNTDTSVNDGSTNNRFIITDSVNSKGLVYYNDYSANFTTYSLVTKGYVDAQVVNSISKYSTTMGFTASITETINHNLGTDEVVVQCYNSSGEMIIPGTVQINGANDVDITFSSNISNIKIVVLG